MVTTLFDNHLKQIKPQEEKKKLQVLASEFAPKLRLQFKENGEKRARKKGKQQNMNKKSWHAMVCHNKT